MFFKFSNNAGLTDIKKLGHVSGGTALSLRSFKHLFFQSRDDVRQVVDSFFLWGCPAPLLQDFIADAAQYERVDSFTLTHDDRFFYMVFQFTDITTKRVGLH